MFNSDIYSNIKLPEPIEFESPFVSGPVYDRIIEQVREFQASLDSEHEVGAYFAAFGQPAPLLVTKIGHQYPTLVIFEGEIEGRRTRLVQHMSQVNFLLVAIPVKDERPARRIGFSST